MSPKINTDSVDGGMLADGWHKVDKNSFEMDSYEFSGEKDSMEQGDRRLSGGQEKLVPAAGATWTEPDGTKIFCPTTAILAVRYAPKKESARALRGLEPPT
jgi:hypothetical protein